MAHHLQAEVVKRFPDNPQVESESGAGGPFAGGLAALGCVLLAHLTKDPFYLSLAFLGFAVNLFNLIPFAFLDGATFKSEPRQVIGGGAEPWASVELLLTGKSQKGE